MNALSGHELSDDFLTLVTFSIGEQRMAIPASILREVLDPLPVTRVPGAGRFAPGVVNVRGSVVPVADLGVSLGLQRATEGDRLRFMVTEVVQGADRWTVVIPADAVHEVATVARADLMPVPATMSQWPPEYLHGLYKAGSDFVILPDLTQIFSSTAGRTS